MGQILQKDKPFTLFIQMNIIFGSKNVKIHGKNTKYLLILHVNWKIDLGFDK